MGGIGEDEQQVLLPPGQLLGLAFLPVGNTGKGAEEMLTRE